MHIHTQFWRNVGKIACKKSTRHVNAMDDGVGDENVCTVV